MDLIDDGRVIGSWRPRAREDRDDDEASDVTVGTAVDDGDHAAIGIGGGSWIVWRGRRGFWRRCRWERRPRGVELSPAGRTGEAVVADLGKAAWEHALKKAREERGRGQRAACHLPGTPVTQPERDTSVGEGLKPAVGDRDPENVAPQVFEHPVSGAGRLHVDDPVMRPRAGRDLIGQVGPAQGVVHLAAKDGREDVTGEEAVGTRRRDPAGAVEREAPTGNEDMDVRVIPQVLRPRMQDGEDRGAGAEMLGIGRDAEQGLGGGSHERVVHHPLMGARDRAELLRQGEGDEEIGARQQPRPVAIEPAPRLLPVALGAVAIATGVIAVLGLVAVVALPEMPTARGGTTGDEVVEGAAMRREQTGAVRLTIGGAGRAHDVGDLEHACRACLHEAVHQVLDGIEGEAFHLRRQVRIEGGRFRTGVAQIGLNQAEVDARFEEVGGVRVAQRIHTLPMNRAPRLFTIVTIRSTENP